MLLISAVTVKVQHNTFSLSTHNQAVATTMPSIRQDLKIGESKKAAPPSIFTVTSMLYLIQTSYKPQPVHVKFLCYSNIVVTYQQVAMSPNNLKCTIQIYLEQVER